MFNKLQNRFSKIFSDIRGHGKISEQNISKAIREIRIALLESDVNFKVVSSFINRVKEKALGEKVLKLLESPQSNCGALLSTTVKDHSTFSSKWFGKT